MITGDGRLTSSFARNRTTNLNIENKEKMKKKQAKKEEQYVYPCYAYDDGLCKSVKKYNLEY